MNHGLDIAEKETSEAEVRIKKKKQQCISELWDDLSTNVCATGVYKEEEKEAETENIFEEIMT